MHKDLQEHWTAEQWALPGHNCIVYPDGTVTILSHWRFYDTGTRKKHISITPLCDSTLDSILRYDPDPWVLVDAWTELAHESLRFFGGDGAMGNEGFLACTDAGDSLVWAIFFDDTNPFKRLWVKDGRLYAVSEHDDLELSVNLSQPTEITATYLTT